MGISRALRLAPLLGMMVSTAFASEGGVTFTCNQEKVDAFTSQIQDYLGRFDISLSAVALTKSAEGLQLTLAAPFSQSSPLDFYTNPALALRDEMVALPKGPNGELVKVQTVSRKEIVLALLHPGREVKAPCDMQEFEDHVGIRQNIVAWSEKLFWNWPEGGPASWNKDYWLKGTPTPDKGTLAAFYNAFQAQDQYGIGCYTATKLVVGQGVLDYYARVRPDAERLEKVLRRVESDKDPLVDIEPRAMWAFEEGYDRSEHEKPGKLLTLQHNVKPLNFVPGDWAYILNTDSVSYQHTGYEGSNAIYLGRGKFDDYYNDHSNSYSYRQKLNEVYQWRNGVFSRTRDGHKVTPLSESDFLQLSKSPEDGGLVVSYRAVPYFLKYVSD